METFWTVVTLAVFIGLTALPFAVLALLWHAAGPKRAASGTVAGGRRQATGGCGG